MKNFIFYYCIVIVSTLLFLHGFFPLQQTPITDTVQLPTSLNDVEFNVTRLYKQEINRLILVVIDALRMDFITAENMPFLVSTYRNEGCILNMRVESPTVTLPRIKALTTGGIPQFIDVILNLASTEILEDSFLHRAKEAGRKIIFYGDDTWIKLYPNIFDRYEGVSSFYVTDYTEVDNNVTDNVVKELNNGDWDIMVLHYLGLDHIGHVYGPYSYLVQPKLREMDNVVEQIYESLRTRNEKSLVVVTGDHGMKDSGGHGGSTNSETHVPFIPLGMHCQNTSVAQTDVPATLATLMGLSHPASSVGCVISSMLNTFPMDRLLYILRYNLLFLQSKLKSCENLLHEASILHYNFMKLHTENDAIKAQHIYEQCSRKISETLVHSSVKQDIHSLLINSEVLVFCLCSVFYQLLKSTVVDKRMIRTEQIFVVLILLLQVAVAKFAFLTIASLLILSIFVLRYIILIAKATKWTQRCDTTAFLICGTVMHSISLISSSFIEEEHQIWYFLWGTFTLISFYFTSHKLKALEWMLLFLGLRLLRTINQTGDKWAHLPDFSQWLLLEENYYYLQALYGTGLLLTWVCCFFLQGKQKSMSILIAINLILIYIFHTFKVGSFLLVKLIWFFTFLNFCLGIRHSKKHLEYVIITWTMSCALLMRPYNVILLPACIYASVILKKHINNVVALTISHIWLGKTLFFCQGHSNSLASIDIAAGYVGLKEYIPFVVIIQVVCHTYAFPVLTNLLLLRNSLINFDIVWMVNTICGLLALVVTSGIIVIQQHHLFVWTVFAPKLLVEACHSAILFMEIILFYFVLNVYKAFIKAVR